MGKIEDEELRNELNECEDILKGHGLIDAFRPDWADCPNQGLEVGCDYLYYFDEEVCMRGHVLYNDGVTAILKVVNRYEECCFHVFHYDEIKQFYFAFIDPETTRLSEYFCLDVETENLLFFRDPDDDVIKNWREEKNGEWKLCEVDPVAFRIERMKKVFLSQFTKFLKEKEDERKKEAEAFDSVINVDLDDTAIQDMYKEYDQEHGNPSSDDTFSYSLNRSLHWLNHRNCAVLTAWRGHYSRSENDNRNRNLQRTLRESGYGVIRVKGFYTAVDKTIERENSFLVFDLNDSNDFLENIYVQSEFYEQESFLYKPIDENVAYLIGTNDEYGKCNIDIAGVMRINSDVSENYSKINSGKISFEKK